MAGCLLSPLRLAQILAIQSAFLFNYRKVLYMMDDPAVPSDVHSNGNQSQAIGRTAARDKYNEISGTPFFPHYTGVSEDIFDAVFDRMDDRMYEPRNIHFEYSRLQNQARKRRSCKISNQNRLIHFLHQMRTGEILWDAALDHGWNYNSSYLDFYHVLWHFVDKFKDMIKPMSPAAKSAMKGLWPPYHHAYQVHI